MSVEFGSVPFPDSPIDEYFQKRYSPYRDFSPPSSAITSPILDEEKAMMKLQAIAERQSLESSDESVDEDGLLMSKEASAAPTTTPLEYTISPAKKLTFLGLYFLLNIALTISNKHLLVKIRTPWLLTASHATATSIGCLVYLASGRLKLSPLSRKEHCILVAFSSLFTINIAISNVSLALVSIPFHQIVRSTCPIVTVLIYRVVFGRSYSLQTYVSMIPLIIGVGLTTVGDYSFTIIGFLVTFAGVVTAATKSIATNRLMTGSLALSPLELLARMSPLAAAQCLFYSSVSGEFSKVGEFVKLDAFSVAFVFAVVLNASMAFVLNMVSFETNKLAGALTMSICGNVKQTVTIALGIVLFNVQLTLLNGFGMALAAMGATWYSLVELRQRNSK